MINAQCILDVSSIMATLRIYFLDLMIFGDSARLGYQSTYTKYYGVGSNFGKNHNFEILISITTIVIFGYDTKCGILCYLGSFLTYFVFAAKLKYVTNQKY